MKAAERRQRDTEIFMYRRRGLSLATLAHTYGLTERQCRRIIDKERERQAASFDRVAEERLDQIYDAYEAAAEELALAADQATSSSGKVLAIAARARIIREQACLLAEAGLLPSYRPRYIEDTASLSVSLADILKRDGVPKETIFRCVDAIADWTNHRLRAAPPK
jgi:hypothetical protein